MGLRRKFDEKLKHVIDYRSNARHVFALLTVLFIIEFGLFLKSQNSSLEPLVGNVQALILSVHWKVRSQLFS